MNDSNFDAKVNEILTTNGLDFNIDKVAAKGEIEISTINSYGQLVIEKKYLESPYHFLYNSKSGECLNSVKKGYTVSQNKEVVELVLKGMEPFGDQLSVYKGGSLNGGRRIFLQLAIEGDAKVGSDTVKRFVTIIDSNDGSTGLSVGVGDLTMSCTNQFFQFYKSGISRMRHTAALAQRILEIPYLIENALSHSINQIETYNKFVGVKVDNTVKHQLVKHLIGLCEIDPIIQISEASTRVKNSMDELYSMIAIETAQKGNNVWGLHSGVTRWTTHSKSAPRRENGRIESAMLSTNYKTNQKSFDFALDLL
tara:strand:- start:1928 stop:2857 length:930 start_codon:yes stop_codon:yes gene_type:complete